MEVLEKKIHFSYKGITLTAYGAQIRVQSGKDGSKKTNSEATAEPACRFQSPLKKFQREIKEIHRLKNQNWK